MIETRCPECAVNYSLDPKYAGRMVRCRACRHEFRVDSIGHSDPQSNQVITKNHNASAEAAIRPEQACKSCGTVYSIKPEMAGKNVRCRVCGETFQVTALFKGGDSFENGSAFNEVDLPSGRSRSRSSNGRNSLDDLGFLTDFEDDEIAEKPMISSDDDADEMRRAARRGSRAQQSPQPGRGNGMPARRRSQKAGPPPHMLIGIGGALLFFVFLGFMLIRAGGLTAIFTGVDPEIYAEFNQPNDPPLGSPAPKTTGRSEPIGDLGPHRALFEKIIGVINNGADQLATVQDLNSAIKAEEQMNSQGMKVREELIQERARLRKLNRSEDLLILKEVGPRLEAAVERLKRENSRIASLPNFRSGLLNNSAQLEANMRAMKNAMAQAERGGNRSLPGEDPSKYAEVRIARIKNADEEAFVYESLKKLTDPKYERSVRHGAAPKRISIWPVARVSDLAERIDFGKVVRTTGKEIWVLADEIDPMRIKAWKEGKAAAETTRKQNEEAAQLAAQKASEANPPAAPRNQPQIPPGADDVTKGLALVSTKEHFKIQEGLRILIGADFKGRDQEVFDTVSPLLSGDNSLLARDSIGVIVRCKTAGMIDFLAGKLGDNRIRQELIKAFIPLKEPKLAEPLSAVMKDDPWGDSDKALIAIGAPAEEPVIGQLASPGFKVRQRACQILAEIGTEKTLKAMKKLPADTNPWVREAANNAVRSIQNRMKLTRKADTNEI